MSEDCCGAQPIEQQSPKACQDYVKQLQSDKIGDIHDVMFFFQVF
jgi:hypothetical protein